MSLAPAEIKFWAGSDDASEDVTIPEISSGGEGSTSGSTTRRSSRPKRKPKRMVEMDEDIQAPPKRSRESGGGPKPQKSKKGCTIAHKIDKIRLKEELFDEFRAIHNAQEKLRRKEQDFYMKELMRVLPLQPGHRIPNIKILNNALAYIAYLKQKEEEMKAELTVLEHENIKLKKYCKQC